MAKPEPVVYTAEVATRAGVFVATAGGHRAVCASSAACAVLKLAGKLGIREGRCRIQQLQRLEGGTSVWEVRQE